MVPNSTLTAQLARERQRDLMAQAQRHRLAAQVFPAAQNEDVGTWLRH